MGDKQPPKSVPDSLAIESLAFPHLTPVPELRPTLFARATAYVLGAGFLMIALAMGLLFFYKFSNAATLTFLVGGVCLVAAGFVGAFKAEKLAEDRRRGKVKQVLTEGSSSIEYFEKLVNINVENLSAYYVTVKSHANKSFLTSLFVGVVGFILIGSGIGLALNDTQHGPSVSLLAGISGVATEFISAVFFYLYNQTVRQMKEYHDSLLAVQNVLLSLKLVGDTSDPAEKAKMIGLMLEYLVGRSRHTATEKASTHPQPKSRAHAQEPKVNISEVK